MIESKARVKRALNSLRKKHRLETGFSMLEAVVVVGVLLALAVGGFFAYGPITQNAKLAKVKSTASEVYTAVMVAHIDGDPTTKPQDVIDTYNASTEKIRVSLLDPAGESVLLGAMTTAGYIPQTDKDICVSAVNIAESDIKASFGNCPDPVATPAPTPTETATPSPVPTPAPAPVEEMWQESNPNVAASIYSIAMTDTGKIHLVGNSTFITSSSDMGVTWSPNSDGGKLLRQQIVTSKNGNIVITGSTASGQSIRISRDGGATYASPVTFVNGATGATVSPPTGFKAFAMSDDGHVMIAISTASNSPLWVSNDYGVTWADQSAKSYVATTTKVTGGNSVSISSDGSKIFVTNGVSQKYSNDSGNTWILNNTSATTSIFSGKYSSDMSSDGNIIVASAASNSTLKGIVKSVDGGKTWTTLTNPNPSYTNSWYAVVCSDDCSKMAVLSDGTIHFSADSGQTWKKQEKIAPQLQWASPIALSSDGSTLAIGDSAGKFFIGTPKP